MSDEITAARAEVLAELTRAMAAVAPSEVEAAIGELRAARRVFVVGVGRVSLMLQAFAKRLAQVTGQPRHRTDAEAVAGEAPAALAHHGAVGAAQVGAEQLAFLPGKLLEPAGVEGVAILVRGGDVELAQPSEQAAGLGKVFAAATHR